MDFRITSAPAAFGKGPIVNVQAVTTLSLKGEWQNFDKGAVETIAVIGRPDQHDYFGEIAVSGRESGKFSVPTAFKDVRSTAELQFVLVSKNHKVVAKKAEFRVFAHMIGTPLEINDKSRPMLKVEETTVISGPRGATDMPLRFRFKGVTAPALTTNLTLSFLMGNTEALQQELVYAKAADYNAVASMLLSDERFIGRPEGSGIEVVPVLRAIKRGDYNMVLAEQYFPFTLGELPDNDGSRPFRIINDLGL